MFKYTLAVTSPEYWNTIHNALIVDSNEDGIPDRKVTCSDCKEHSPTRGTYLLSHEEANEIAKHPQVKWIELSPSDYRHAYPDPRPATKRFRKNVKIYRNLPTTAFSISATSAEENRTNWAVRRVGLQTNGDGWPNTFGTQVSPTFSDIKYSLTGKNVDLVIQDSGVLQYHPEFIDDDGKSRVRDIILDGPYYIDPSYFTSNNYTYTKPDGRIGITTASAHSWWENSSNRSGSFSSIGTLSVPNAYTVANSLGIGGTSHTMTSSHGTGCAGLAAGKNFGLAFESNIWTISIFAPANIATEASYDALKIFHQHKPVNTATGRKNPTVVNGSWGYYGAFNSNTTVTYKFKGSTGTFTGYSITDTGAQAYAYGLSSMVSYNRGFATSSRSHSIDAAGAEMIDAGVIFVVAAGNDNQRLGIGTDDIQKNDYFTSLVSGNDHRGTSLFPSGTLPIGSRDYLHPQGVGFNTSTDFHPVICVGAMDDTIEQSYEGYEHELYAEMKASYSNNGPGIDVWAPADETLSAGMRAANGDQLGTETNYARYNSNFVDRYFNGTSAASPVVAGSVALFLESKPDATSADVKEFIRTHGSVGVSTDKYLDPFPVDDNQYYWSTSRNLRGAHRNVLFDPTASDTRPTFSGVIGGESIITSGLVLNLDGNNYTSGTTWTDTSGQGNNGTLVGGIGYSSDNGGYLIFDGSNDYIQLPTNSDLTFAGDFSFETWLMTDTQLTSNHIWYMSGATLQFSNNVSPDQIIYYSSGTGNQAFGVLDNDKWGHLILTKSGNTLTGYLNGEQAWTNTPGSSATHNFSGIRIGTRGSTAGYEWDGKFAAVRIYSKGLTASDVQHNFDAMKGRYLDNPLILSGISYSLT